MTCCAAAREASSRLSSSIAFSEKDRESANWFLGWPLANPGFSSRICFVMTSSAAGMLSRGEDPQASPVFRSERLAIV